MVGAANSTTHNTPWTELGVQLKASRRRTRAGTLRAAISTPPAATWSIWSPSCPNPPKPQPSANQSLTQSSAIKTARTTLWLIVPLGDLPTNMLTNRSICRAFHRCTRLRPRQNQAHSKSTQRSSRSSLKLTRSVQLKTIIHAKTPTAAKTKKSFLKGLNENCPASSRSSNANVSWWSEKIHNCVRCYRSETCSLHRFSRIFKRIRIVCSNRGN